MKTLFLKTKLLAVIVIAIICSNTSAQSFEIAKSSDFQNELFKAFKNEQITRTSNSINIIINSDQIFEPNSSELKQEINTDITKAINILRKYKKYEFNVLVHSAIEGADDINLSISQKRAEVLTKYLNDNKLKSKRFKCIGIGESQSNLKSFNRIEFIIPYNGI